mmetsp:Transcript_104463/g.272746  ORF Transcript_104463/g.272746 Transcript_104463/m.272746 type:complete len:244 (-) Transcript_104463:586-1317(-)
MHSPSGGRSVPRRTDAIRLGRRRAGAAEDRARGKEGGGRRRSEEEDPGAGCRGGLCALSCKAQRQAPVRQPGGACAPPAWRGARGSGRRLLSRGRLSRQSQDVSPLLEVQERALASSAAHLVQKLHGPSQSVPPCSASVQEHHGALMSENPSGFSSSATQPLNSPPSYVNSAAQCSGARNPGWPSWAPMHGLSPFSSPSTNSKREPAHANRLWVLSSMAVQNLLISDGSSSDGSVSSSPGSIC